MSAYSFYATFVLVMTFLLNSYKFVPMLLYNFGLIPHYYVFPWQGAQGQISGSSGLWLCIHLASALTHVLLTYDKIYSIGFSSAYMNQFKYKVKVVFEVIIAINVWNFGEFTALQAIAINGGLLFFSRVHYESNTKLYYALTTLPIALEFLVLSSQVVRYLL